MSEQSLSQELVIRTLPNTRWDESVVDTSAIDALEQGKVLFLPQLAFTLTAEEQMLLTPQLVDAKRKTSALIRRQIGLTVWPMTANYRRLKR